MGFLQRLFSRGKSKKQQNGNATDEEGVIPKTRHSLSVITALVDRDRRKAQSSARPSTDSPLDEDPSLTRLLRTNSANFRVINEIDYQSFPPLGMPLYSASFPLRVAHITCSTPYKRCSRLSARVWRRQQLQSGGPQATHPCSRRVSESKLAPVSPRLVTFM